MPYVTLAESFIRRLVGKGVTLEYAFLNQAAFCHDFLYESLSNILKLKHFRFSLWMVLQPCRFYTKNQHRSADSRAPGNWPWPEHWEPKGEDFCPSRR